MRRGLALALATTLALALVIAGGLASRWTDAERIARAAVDRVCARLDCSATFERADVHWLPRPVVRLREARLEDAIGRRAVLTAERVDLRLSPLALLRGDDAVRSLALEGGVAEVGPYRLQDVRIRGSGRGPFVWNADASVDVGPDRGSLVLAGSDRSVGSARLVVAFHDLDLDVEGLTVRGGARLEARLAESGASYQLDLAAAEVALVGQGTTLRKPAGVHASATGPVPQRLPRPGGDWDLRLDALEIGRSRLQGEVYVRSGRPSGELSGEIDLADLAAWSGWTFVRGGRLRLERLAWAPPLPLHGVGRAERARIELGERPWQLTFSGPLSLLGSGLSTKRAVAAFQDEVFQVAGSWDLGTKRWELEMASKGGVELANLAESMEIGPLESGRAYGRADLRGGPDLSSLVGHGEFEVFDGTAAHLSLKRVTPTGVGPGTGPHAFERLSGLFEIRDRRIELIDLVLEQDSERARVSGAVSLADGAVDLAGGAEYVVGQEPITTPIQLSGTVDRLRASVEDPPEVQAERREAELAMLEAMLVQLRERPAPEDPARAGALREHVQRIEERLHEIRTEDDA